MNLYLRYFDRETLVSTVDDAIDFLRSIDEIEVDPELEADIASMLPAMCFTQNDIRFIPVSISLL